MIAIEDVDFSKINQMLSSLELYDTVNSITNENDTFINIGLLSIYGFGIFEVIKELGISLDVKMNVVKSLHKNIERVSLSKYDRDKELKYYKENIRKKYKDVILCIHDKNLDEIAVHGKVKFIECLPGSLWSGEVIKNPTWMDVCGEVQKMIDDTNDRHHVYLESIELVTEFQGVKVINFSMGS